LFAVEERGNRGGEICDRIVWRKRRRSGKRHRILSSRETNDLSAELKFHLRATPFRVRLLGKRACGFAIVLP
jgi:hypothetical protein